MIPFLCYECAAAKIKFNFFKIGFYYQPYGKTQWTRLNGCFTMKAAINKTAELQIKSFLEN